MFPLQMLKDRFKDFARDTESIGTERVSAASENCDQLIAVEHSDAAAIAEWKDNLNEAWNDLLELIDTRTQMLQASWELHKFYSECKDTLERIVVSYFALVCRSDLMLIWLYSVEKYFVFFLREGEIALYPILKAHFS